MANDQNISKIKRLGMIVGGGQLPQQIARSAAKNGTKVFPINLDGCAAPDTALSHGPWYCIGSIGGILDELRTNNIRSVCFAGLVPRPDFSTIVMDDVGQEQRANLIAAGQQSDDALLRAIIEIFEREGFAVIAPDAFASKLLAGEGALGNAKPGQRELADLHKAKAIAQAIGQLDIGQGAIVCNGLILAVEAQEGTDEMLRRCAKLPASLRGSQQNPAGALVKFPKPGQEIRVDLPTLGVTTIELAIQAGLAGIGFAAHQTFLIEQDEMCALADAHQFFLYGMSL